MFKYIFMLWLCFAFSDCSFASSVSVYAYGQNEAPRLEADSKKFIIYPTTNMTKTYLNMRIEMLRDDNVAKVKQRGRYVLQYSNKIFFRMYLINSQKVNLDGIKVCVQYFAYNLSSEKNEDEAFRQVYSLESVPPQKQIVVDIPAKEFRYLKLRRNQKPFAGQEFCGCIFSVFHEGKLIFQRTSNRNLRKLGIKEL